MAAVPIVTVTDTPLVGSNPQTRNGRSAKDSSTSRENYYGFPPTGEKTIKVENIDRHVYAPPLKCPETITSIKSCCHVTRYT